MYKILLPICFLATLVAARSPRIANGIDGKDGEVKDSVTVYVFFETRWAVCGGIWYKDQWVLTTASCVFDPSQQATNITVVFNGVKGSFRADPPIGMKVPAAVADMYVTDFALLFLPTFNAVTLKIDPKKNAPLTLEVTPDSTMVASGNNYKVCGFGSTTDSPNYVQAKIKCANMTTVPIARCVDSKNPKPAEIVVPATDSLCLAPLGAVDPKLKGLKGNACAGDYGGALYSQDGTKVIGLLSFSPNFKIGSCLDGHFVLVATISMDVKTWIDTTISAAG